jgi:hypothetical protein
MVKTCGDNGAASCLRKFFVFYVYLFYPSVELGLDHGVGHPLLLLYAVKAPNDKNSNEFKGLYHYPSDAL